MSMLSFRNIMRTKIMKPEMSIYTALVIPYDRLQSGDVKTLESSSTCTGNCTCSSVDAATPSNKTATTT
jgi:hypothetical protein